MAGKHGVTSSVGAVPMIARGTQNRLLKQGDRQTALKMFFKKAAAVFSEIEARSGHRQTQCIRLPEWIAQRLNLNPMGTILKAA